MRSVLIVDDNDATRELLALALQLAGFTVGVASDGAEALEAIAHEPPAAMVVDFRMPGMSGLEVINRARATPGLQGVCAILATAWCETPEDIDPSVVLIEKPFAIKRLVEVLKSHGVPTGPPRSPAVTA